MSTFHLAIKDFLSSGKIEKARSAQGAALYSKVSIMLLLCARKILSRTLIGEAAVLRPFDRDLLNRGVVYIRAFFVAPSEWHETYTTL